MTNQDATYILSGLRKSLHEYCGLNDNAHKAFDMAISALQAQDLQPSCNQVATNTIDRQAAIDALDCINGTEEVLRSLPSAQPDGISIEWINKHLEWLDNCDNDFAQIAKVGIRAMVELWKKDRI